MGGDHDSPDYQQHKFYQGHLHTKIARHWHKGGLIFDEEIINHLISDLKEAQELLFTGDPYKWADLHIKMLDLGNITWALGPIIKLKNKGTRPRRFYREEKRKKEELRKKMEDMKKPEEQPGK